MITLEQVWDWSATAWLVVIPCLWWKGLAQDHVQSLAWHLGTAWLVALSLALPPRRSWRATGWASGLLVAVLITSLWHLPPQGYPLVVLHSLMAWLSVWCLVTYAKTGAWILTRLGWLCLANIGYGLVQWGGYDPLFTTTGITGLFSKPNQLACLCLVCLPLMNGWTQALPLAAICLTDNLTAMLGAMGWIVHRMNTKAKWLSILVIGGCILRQLLQPWCWSARVLPRLLVWKVMLSQCLYGSLVGYGMGAWNTLTPYPRDPYGYSVYLDTWHLGGIGVLALVVVALWRVVRSPASPGKSALLGVAWCGLTQDVWNSTRMIMVSLALLAAWLIGRTDENPAGTP